MEENPLDLPDGVIGEICFKDGKTYAFTYAGWLELLPEEYYMKDETERWRIMAKEARTESRESPSSYTPEEIEQDAYMRVCANENCSWISEMHYQQTAEWLCIVCLREKYPT